MKIPTSQYANIDCTRDRTAYSTALVVSKAITELIRYDSDPTCDMFQIGRCKRENIDFSIQDDSCMQNFAEIMQISRFACRIIANRDGGESNTISLLSAGFDENRNIFLGENAAKWYSSNGQIDGFTTNGIYVCQPLALGDHDAINGKNPIWMQISIEGNAYPVDVDQKR